MKVIEPIGACVVAVSLVFDGQKHVEHASYHGEARATQPLGTVLETWDRRDVSESFCLKVWLS